jgi:hypothetical protein
VRYAARLVHSLALFSLALFLQELGPSYACRTVQLPMIDDDDYDERVVMQRICRDAAML